MNTMIRCLNCMQEYDNQFDMCPFCGSEKGIRPRELYFLTPGVILADRYEIGTSLGGTAGLENRVLGEKDMIIYSGRRERECLMGKFRFLEEARNMAKYNTHAKLGVSKESFLISPSIRIDFRGQ